jgi:hypothetical protein
MIDHLPLPSALRAFEAAARHMCFSKAAEELFVTGRRSAIRSMRFNIISRGNFAHSVSDPCAYGVSK